MTKRMIEIDDDLIDSARRALHTTGVSDTVQAALRAVVAIGARRRQVQWLTSGGMEPISNRDLRNQVWH